MQDANRLDSPGAVPLSSAEPRPSSRRPRTGTSSPDAASPAPSAPARPPARSAGRRRRWPWIVLLLLLLGSASILPALRRPTVIAPEKIVKVERGDIARSVVAVGQIEPFTKVELKSKANGIIQALLVDVGDPVAEGQVLVELDKENLDAQVRQAVAQRDAEEANLQVIAAAEARARIEALNPEADFVRREFERVRALVEQRIVSPQALDDAQKAFAVSTNRQQLLEAAARSATAQVTQARARVAAARAALDQAEENRRHATVRSPIRGVVLTRDRELGDAVSSILNLGSAATLVMTLGDLGHVYVQGLVDEVDIGKIRVGMPVRTRVESFPGETFDGVLTRIAPMGKKKDNVTTFEVRVSIDNPQGKLRANMTANAEVVLEDRKKVLLVPEAALIYDRDGNATVRQLESSEKTGYRAVPVKVGISNGQRRELLDGGVPEGTRLVLP